MRKKPEIEPEFCPVCSADPSMSSFRLGGFWYTRIGCRKEWCPNSWKKVEGRCIFKRFSVKKAIKKWNKQVKIDENVQKLQGY